MSKPSHSIGQTRCHSLTTALMIGQKATVLAVPWGRGGALSVSSPFLFFYWWGAMPITAFPGAHWPAAARRRCGRGGGAGAGPGVGEPAAAGAAAGE